MYVTNVSTDNILVIDSETYEVVRDIQVGTTPVEVQISRDGRRGFVVNEGSNDISIVDLVSGKVIRTIPVGTRPSGLAFR